MKKTKILVLNSIALLVPVFALAHADDGLWTCKMGKSVRKVEIKYSTQGQKVPCGVFYTKEGQAEGKEIYHYSHESGVCEAKAKAFAEKLGGLGFACE